MAKQTNTRLFLGEDKALEFTIYNDAETAIVNITGWSLSFMIKRYKSDADGAALLTKTTGSGIVISGTYNSIPATNTQIATVTILDTETTGLAEGLAYYELKRMDANFETVLAYGTLQLPKAVHS